MISAWRSVSLRRRTSLLTACLGLFAFTQLCGAGKTPMTVLKYDPDAEKMDLFDGLKSNAFSVRIVADDVQGGHLYIENKTKKSLTVNLPEAIAMVHVLKQVGNMNGLGFGSSGLAGGGSSMFGMQGNKMGGGQSLGSGFGQQMGNSFGSGNNGFGNGQFNGNGQGNGQGFGFFSIPPERIAQVPYQSVCLNFGRPDPAPRMTYRPVPLEEFTSDKVLQETLRMFGQGQLNQNVAQAAAWHLTDQLNWNELASLQQSTIPGFDLAQAPTFNRAELYAAQQLLKTATQRAEERARTEVPAAPKLKTKSKAKSKTKANVVAHTSR